MSSLNSIGAHHEGRMGRPNR